MVKRKEGRRAVLILIFLSVSLFGIANNFRYVGEVVNENDKDYFKILLTPEVTRYLHQDFSDIRIFDSNNQVVPYVFEKDTTNRVEYIRPVYTDVSIKDSLGDTYIQVLFDTKMYVSTVLLDIDTNVLYKRKIELVFAENKKHFDSDIFDLSSEQKGLVAIHRVFSKKLLFRIHNGDNPPLAINSCSFGHESTSLLTILGTGSYSVMIGSDSVKKAKYDMAYFAHVFPSHIQELKVNNIHANKSYVPYHKPVDSDETWIWFVMITVVLLLSGVAIKLILDVRKSVVANNSEVSDS